MQQPNMNTKISVTCPSGHRLRGGALLVGKPVRCPKCHTHFVFAPTKPESSPKSMTDTGVMRILGDMPSTDPTPRVEASTRPCSRCGVAIPDSAAVCNHCNCYVGVLPTFLQQLTSESQAEQN